MDFNTVISNECAEFKKSNTLYNKLCKISNIATLCNNFIKLHNLDNNVPYFDTFICKAIVYELTNESVNVKHYVIRLELYIIQLFQCNTENILINKYNKIYKIIKHIPNIINRILIIYNL
jgi:hypothetical protein